jgi:hypothetical protein
VTQTKQPPINPERFNRMGDDSLIPISDEQAKLGPGACQNG